MTCSNHRLLPLLQQESVSSYDVFESSTFTAVTTRICLKLWRVRIIDFYRCYNKNLSQAMTCSNHRLLPLLQEESVSSYDVFESLTSTVVTTRICLKLWRVRIIDFYRCYNKNLSQAMTCSNHRLLPLLQQESVSSYGVFESSTSTAVTRRICLRL